MSILYVIRQAPFPPTKGVEQRAYHIGKLLQQIGCVTLVMVVREISAEKLRKAKDEFQQVYVFKLPKKKNTPAARLRAKIKVLQWGEFEGTVSWADDLTFRQMCSAHDLVWFHTLGTADCFTGRTYPKAVMDIDDINHIKYALEAKLPRTLKRKLVAKWLAYKWRLRETAALEQFSTMTVCSPGDKSYFGNDDRICVVPNGFDRPAAEPIYQSPKAGHIGFIGALNYAPNRDGLGWFGNEVWPIISRELPEVRCRIVGKLPEKRTILDKQGFDALGFVEDPRGEMSTWSAMVVPLRIGGGTRIKILEAFSRKCPVVSTSIGAHGIEAKDGLNIFLADEPESFAKACIKLVREPQVGEQLAAEGWKLFCNKYSWDKIEDNVRRAVISCLKLSDKKVVG